MCMSTHRPMLDVSNDSYREKNARRASLRSFWRREAMMAACWEPPSSSEDDESLLFSDSLFSSSSSLLLESALPSPLLPPSIVVPHCYGGSFRG